MAGKKEPLACQQPIKGELQQSSSHAFFHLPLTQILGALVPLFSASTANTIPSPSIMAGFSTNRKWEASTVTDGDIMKLRQAGYLSADIAHRAPEEGQVIPAPKPGERVIFLPHFLRGLDFLCTPS